MKRPRLLVFGVICVVLTAAMAGCSPSRSASESPRAEPSSASQPRSAPEGSRARQLIESLEAAGFGATLTSEPSAEATSGLLMESAYVVQVGKQHVFMFQMASQVELDAAVARLEDLGEPAAALYDPNTQASSHWYRQNGLIVMCSIRGEHPIAGEDRKLVDHLRGLLGTPFAVQARP